MKKKSSIAPLFRRKLTHIPNRTKVQRVLRSIRNQAILACFHNGIHDPHVVKQTIAHAVRDMSPVCVMGIKSAMTKGQTILVKG